MKYPLVLASFYTQAWALEPQAYAALERILLERAEGQDLSPEARSSLSEKEYGATADVEADTVAVIPIYGPIIPRASAFSEVSQVASHQGIAQALRAAADDDSVREIVIDMDSPGGSVNGIDVSSEGMRYATSRKKVTVVTEGVMASAAYWLASLADRVVASSTSMVGSISVIMEHQDRSKFNERLGVSHEVLTTGKYKALGNPNAPLSDDHRDKMLEGLMAVHDLFVEAVAEGRGVTAAEAQSRWADGSIWIGHNALEAGLVDEIGTLEHVLNTLTDTPTATPSTPRRRATMDLEKLKIENPELYAQIMAEARAEIEAQSEVEVTAATRTPAPAASTPAPVQANTGNSELEKEVVRLRASVEAQQEETRTERRKGIAATALENAALPKAGKVGDIDLDASFRSRVEALAMNADSDDAARTQVDAEIAERRALLGKAPKEAEPKKRRAFLASNDLSAPDKDAQPKAGSALANARRYAGL